VSGGSGRFPARAREGFWVRQDGNTWLFLHGAAAVYLLGHLTAGHVIMLAQGACRQICSTHAHGRELEAPAGIFLEGDSAWRDLVHGPGYLIYRGGEVPVVHADDRFPCLFDPVHDLLVFDLQLGIALGLLSYALPDVVVLAGVWSHIGQDGHLVDVGIVFRVDVFELRMECLVAGAGQAGKSLVDLYIWITNMEVGVVVISRELAGGCVGDFVGLGREALTLYKSSEGFCIAEGFCS